MVIRTTLPEKTKNIDTQSVIKKILSPLTDDELVYYLGKEARNKIITYKELENFNDINQILPNDIDYVIILIETQINKGHWICLLKYNKTLEIFNSYGDSIQKEMKFVPKLIKDYLGQEFSDISKLLNDAKDKGYKIIENKTEFQAKDSRIQTCGRFCVIRIICLIKFGMNLKEFTKFIYEKTKLFNQSPDFIASLYI